MGSGVAAGRARYAGEAQRWLLWAHCEMRDWEGGAASTRRSEIALELS